MPVACLLSSTPERTERAGVRRRGDQVHDHLAAGEWLSAQVWCDAAECDMAEHVALDPDPPARPWRKAADRDAWPKPGGELHRVADDHGTGPAPVGGHAADAARYGPPRVRAPGGHACSRRPDRSWEARRLGGAWNPAPTDRAGLDGPDDDAPLSRTGRIVSNPRLRISTRTSTERTGYLGESPHEPRIR